VQARVKESYIFFVSKNTMSFIGESLADHLKRKRGLVRPPPQAPVVPLNRSLPRAENVSPEEQNAANALMELNRK
jgi:hypothetical protein